MIRRSDKSKNKNKNKELLNNLSWHLAFFMLIQA